MEEITDAEPLRKGCPDCVPSAATRVAKSAVTGDSVRVAVLRQMEPEAEVPASAMLLMPNGPTTQDRCRDVLVEHDALREVRSNGY